MKKITDITLRYEDGTEVGLSRENTQWLFVAQGYGFRQMSLSGNSQSDAFLLLILQMAVTQTLSATNKLVKKET